MEVEQRSERERWIESNATESGGAAEVISRQGGGELACNVDWIWRKINIIQERKRVLLMFEQCFRYASKHNVSSGFGRGRVNR